MQGGTVIRMAYYGFRSRLIMCIDSSLLDVQVHVQYLQAIFVLILKFFSKMYYIANAKMPNLVSTWYLSHFSIKPDYTYE